MSPPRILIVDDEPHMLRLIELSLRRGGYDLVTARDGLEAVKTALEVAPDLIVMDLVMPNLDGLQALARLKADALTRSIPVIMLTARGQVLTKEETDRSGFDLYLTKPFSPTELLSSARALLRRDGNSPSAARNEGTP